MNPFSFLFGLAWEYRAEIVLAVQALSALRKKAEDWTREYIRRRVQQKLARQVALVSVETACLVIAFFVAQKSPTLGARLFASAVLWAITLYNAIHLCFATLPELVEVYRVLRGKIGFTLKYVLRITLVTELMELDVAFLILALCLALSSRGLVASRLSFVKPWKELAHRVQAPSRRHSRPHGRYR